MVFENIFIYILFIIYKREVTHQITNKRLETAVEEMKENRLRKDEAHAQLMWFERFYYVELSLNLGIVIG